MKKITLLIAFVLTILSAAYAQDETVVNGEIWQKLNKENKIFYLAGYLKGSYRGMLIGLRDVECISYKEIVSLAQEKYRNFVGKGNMQVLFNEIDNIYQNKKNIGIELDEIIVFALKKSQEDMSLQKQEVWLDLLRTMNQTYIDDENNSITNDKFKQADDIRDKVKEGIVQGISDIKNKTPIKINENTELIDMKLNGMEISIYYRFLNIDSDAIAMKQNIMAETKRETINYNMKNDKIRMILNSGFVYKYIYFYENEIFGYFTIDNKSIKVSLN